MSDFPEAGARPARQTSLRDRNLALVLGAVAGAPEPLSRADVATRTGLTKGTVSTLVDALLGASFLAELEPRRTRAAGRPATDLVLSGEGLAGLGLEINVDYLAACVVDLAGEVRHREVVHADQRGAAPGEVLRRLVGVARGALDVSDGLGLRVLGAALAVPGLVDGGTGLIRVAPNLGWTDVDPLEALCAAPELAGLEVRVGNEADLAALAELHAGMRSRAVSDSELWESSAGPSQSFLYVSGEIGVGAGVVVDGALFRGGRGWSGEIGHVFVGGDGRCRCGASGCLETVAGQDAILAAAAAGSVEALEAAAGGLDPVALDALGRAGTALGLAAAASLNILDLDTLVLGGTYARLADWLLPAVEAELAVRVLSARWAPPVVRVSAAGPDAAVVGAASSVVLAALAAPAGHV